MEKHLFIFSFLVASLTPYFNTTSVPSGVSNQFLPGLALFLFFTLVFIFNSLLKKFLSNFAFTPSELLVIYSMMLVTSAIPSWALVQYLLSIISGVYYYATPSNEWAKLIHPHLKKFLFPQNQEAIRLFYEGLPAGKSIPWNVWLSPLFFWSIFFLILHFVMICMMVILRKQWVEKERLTYPLIILPIEMVKEDRSAIPPFFRNKLMWLGFSIPFVIGTWNAISVFSPILPTIHFACFYNIFRRTTTLWIGVNFIVIGISYFLNLDVALSLWLFRILNRMESGFMNITGFSLPGGHESYFGSSEAVGYQSAGAMILMVAFILWIARSHLKDVFGKAFFLRKDVNDSNEIISYRVSVFGLLIGLSALYIWFCWCGISPFASFVLLLYVFVLFLGITRIIVQGGTGFARPIGAPLPFLGYMVGVDKIGSEGMTFLATTYGWVADTKTLVMTSVAEGLKMVENVRKKKRLFFWAILLACIIGFWVSSLTTISIGYKWGALNTNNPWLFKGASKLPWQVTQQKLLHPSHFSPHRFGFLIFGGFFMWFLMFMRYKFLWWPVHYIGFPIADSEPMRYAWFSVFIAWLIKSFIMRYGGAKIYQNLKPFFLGLVLGQVVVCLFWGIIFSFTSYTSPIGIL